MVSFAHIVRNGDGMKRFSGAWLLGVVLALMVPGLAWAQPPKGIEAGPSIEGISEYRLDNGLRVLLFPDHTKPIVTVNLVYEVGSVQENYGETGMAHLLEHLLFKGTPKHPDINGDMKRRGIGFNATTSMDRTNYFASFPANDDTLDWVLGMEADRMVNSRVDRADLDSEMTVVRNELEAGENSPGGVLGARVRSTAFLWHNYGKSTIGARSDVEGVSIENLRAFYRKWYRPDNATLIIAGRIDPDQVLGRIAHHFGALARPSEPLLPQYTVEPAQDGERTVMVRRAGNIKISLAAYHVPSITHPDSAPLRVLTNILAHTPSGRLHKALVEAGLGAGISANSDASKSPGLMTGVVVVAQGADHDKAESVLLEQLESLGGNPITEDEVKAALRRFDNAFEEYFTNVNAVGMGLSDYQVAGDWRLLFVTRDAIAKVTAEDVNRVAKTYLRPSNRTLGRFIPTSTPDRVEIGPGPTASALVDNYVGRTAVESGEVFDPSPENIASRTQTFVLGEGLKVSFLPKKTRGNTVVFNATFRFGNVEALRGKAAVASMTGGMIVRGSQRMTREQINDAFEGLRTNAGIGGGLQTARIGLSSRRDTLAEALDLAAEILRTPAFPESEFEQVKRGAITGAEAGRNEPGSLAGRAMAEHFNPWPKGHVFEYRGLDTSLADLEALTLDDLRAFHRDFYGTSRGEITVVGDFDPVALRAQIERLFLDWKSPVPHESVSTRYQAVAAKREVLVTPDKPNAVLLARTNIPLRVTDPDYPAMVVANRILGGGAMKSRLGDRIRQKEGLSYSVSSGISADDSRSGQDDAGALTIQAIAAPANMARVEELVSEELDRLVREGVTTEELADAVSGLLVERQGARSGDGTVAGMLANHLYYDRTMAFTADLDAKYAALDVESVNQTIARVLGGRELTVIIAGDFNEPGKN